MQYSETDVTAAIVNRSEAVLNIAIQKMRNLKKVAQPRLNNIRINYYKQMRQ